MKDTHRRILRDVLSAPTAPFAEGCVERVIRDWADRRDLAITNDAAGNLHVRYRRGRPGKGRRWAFLAHMDHPGFIAGRQKRRRLRAEFRGGVRPELFKDECVRFFTPEEDVLAKVTSARRNKDSGFIDASLYLPAGAAVPAGSVGMWNLPVMRIRKTRLTSRALDDLAGVAAVMCAIDELVRRHEDADVIGIFTRGEEAGFAGTLAGCEDGLFPADRCIIGLETSKAQPGAKLGDGVVIRVGDRTWTFDPEATGYISRLADKLARKRRDFRFVRMLMPGGTCETTPLCVWGLRAAALCLPLGNYHNMSDRQERIAPERIDLEDFDCMVALLGEIAVGEGSMQETHKQLLDRLSELLAKRRPLLEGSAGAE
jgi:putative aminopeptidase FrvX